MRRCSMGLLKPMGLLKLMGSLKHSLRGSLKDLLSWKDLPKLRGLVKNLHCLKGWSLRCLKVTPKEKHLRMLNLKVKPKHLVILKHLLKPMGIRMQKVMPMVMGMG